MDVECEFVCSGTSESASVINSNNQPKKKSVNRTYNDTYLIMGFYWTGILLAPSSLCVICYETVLYDSMKPSKLPWHLKKCAEPSVKPTHISRTSIE